MNAQDPSCDVNVPHEKTNYKIDVGIIAMSAKPPHRGHEKMIETACAECDKVYLIVSLSPRCRCNDVVITTAHVEQIWKRLGPRLPDNVKVIYTPISMNTDFDELINDLTVVDPNIPKTPTRDTPIGWSWWIAAVCHAKNTSCHMNVYVGPDDVDRYPRDKIVKYIGSEAHVSVRIIGDNRRLYDISGTQMRTWLSVNDKRSFIDNLPTRLTADEKEETWRTLTLSNARKHP